MKSNPLWPAVCLGALTLGCAAQPDHFYTLNTLPDRGVTASPAPAPVIHVILDTSVPVLNDRSELVVSGDGDRILVLDHERWAAPLSDLVQQTLARDIERRRADVLVADRRFDRPDSPPVTMKVDIVRMSAEPGRRVVIEARWRIRGARGALDEIGSGDYDAPLEGSGYAPIAHAFSVAFGALADALTAALPP